MFTIGIETQFKAWHSVPLPDGTREPKHEHFWAVDVEVSGEMPNNGGMLMGFAQLKSRITEITSKLHDTVMDEADYFHNKCPSAENVAVYIFERLEPTLPKNVLLKSVKVSEQVGCWAIYSKK